MLESILGTRHDAWAEQNANVEYSFLDPDGNEINIEFSPYELVTTFLFPEQFAIHYAPSYINISNILKSISMVKVQWKQVQLSLEINLKEISKKEKEIYLAKRAAGIAHTEAQKSSAVEGEELSIQILSEINSATILQEKIQIIWFYFHAMREVIEGYRQLFPLVQDFLASSHERFLKDLTRIEPPDMDDDLFLHDKNEMETIDL